MTWCVLGLDLDIVDPGNLTVKDSDKMRRMLRYYGELISEAITNSSSSTCWTESEAVASKCVFKHQALHRASTLHCVKPAARL